MRLVRIVSRLSVEQMEKVDAIRARYRKEARRRPSRAAILRAIVEAALTALDAGNSHALAHVGRDRGQRLIRFPLRIPEDHRKRLDDVSDAWELGSRTGAIRAFVDGLVLDKRPVQKQLRLHRPSPPAKRPPPTDSTMPTLRQRAASVFNMRSGEVLDAARVAGLLGVTSAADRDVLRNTLLKLAASGAIQKVGIGQYMACPETKAPAG